MKNPKLTETVGISGNRAEAATEQGEEDERYTVVHEDDDRREMAGKEE
jgi:hypothetical protein